MPFTLTPVPPADADDGANLATMQFQLNGTDLGGATVDTVNFTGDGVTAARGTGDDANTLTVTIAGDTGTGGGGTDTTITELTEDYSLEVTDENTIFWTDVPIEVTVSALATPVRCAFMPPQYGSITLHPSGVSIDGADDDIVVNLLTHPNGLYLTPRYGHDDQYTTAGEVATFDNLPGDPRDNALLAAYLDAKQSAPTILAPYHTLTNATLSQADNGRTFFTTADVARAVNIPVGLSTDFHFYLEVRGGASSTLTAVPLTGTTLQSVGSNGGTPRTSVRRIGATVEVRCTGTQNEFMCVSSQFWGDPGPAQITANRQFIPADDGGLFEVMGAYILLMPINLGWREGVTLQMPDSGTVTIRSNGGTLLNGATSDLTFDITDRVVGILPRSAVDKYDVI